MRNREGQRELALLPLLQGKQEGLEGQEGTDTARRGKEQSRKLDDSQNSFETKESSDV